MAKKRKLKNQTGGKLHTEMITTTTNGFFAWNGKIYDSDIVRAAIRPCVTAIGKLQLQHIYETEDENGNKKFDINKKPYLRFLLMRPNPYMSMQKMLEKLETWKLINNNAFALVVRDENGLPYEIYPIPAAQADAVFNKSGEMFIRFILQNGKTFTFPYRDLIHLRRDFNSNDVFGDSNIQPLRQVMEVVTTIDQGMVSAIKNSGVIRWLIKYTTRLKADDLKKNVQNFVKNYMTISDESMGVAAIDDTGDIKQVETKDFVPNSAQMNNAKERIYSYYNTNEAITQSKWDEDQYNAYYESVIESEILDIQNEFTFALFSRREIGCGNYIYAEASNLECAALKTKLQLIGALDRGALLINEFRQTLKLSPVEWGNTPIRRLDTATVEEGGTEDED